MKLTKRIFAILLALIMVVGTFSITALAEGWSDENNPMPNTCSYGYDTGAEIKEEDLKKDWPDAEIVTFSGGYSKNDTFHDGKIHTNMYMCMHQGTTFSVYAAITNSTKHRIRIYGIKGFKVTAGTIMNQYATLAKDDVRFDQDVDLAPSDVAMVEIDFNVGAFKRNSNIKGYLAYSATQDSFVYKNMD